VPVVAVVLVVELVLEPPLPLDPLVPGAAVSSPPQAPATAKGSVITAIEIQ